MKQQVVFAVGVMVVLAFTTHTRADDAAVRLQQGIYQEETIGDLEAARKIYEQIVADAEANRSHVAQAQYRLGMCLEKQGKAEQAAEAFGQLIRQFPDQSELIAAARSKLDASGRAASTVVVRQVWAPAGDASGSFSGDGRHLSFVDWETGDLAIRELATGHTRRLTNKGPWSKSYESALHSVFSYDGKQIAYQWFNKDGLGLVELRVIGTDGGAHRVLLDDRDLVWLSVHDWSRDGNYILATFERKDQPNQVALISPDDGSVKIVEVPRGPRNPRLSPDGQYIAYSARSDASNSLDVFLFPVEGDHETVLVNHAASDIVLGWTPSDDRLLFASNRSGSMDAWAIPVSDGKAAGSAQLVKAELGQVQPMTITRDGSFYYSVSIRGFEVYVATIDPKTGKILSPPKPASSRFAGTNVGPFWSHDGRTLAFSSVKRFPGSGRTLCFLSLETGEQRDFPMKGKLLANFNAMSWSPDNQYLVARNADAKNYRRGLFQIDVKTGDVSELVGSGDNATYQYPQWTPDGKAVFYQRAVGKWEEGRRRIVRFDVATKQHEEFFPDEIPTLFSLSHDGQQVALVTEVESPRSSVIKRISFAGGDAREVLRLLQPSDEDSEGQSPEEINIYSLTWTPDGRHLLYLAGPGRLGSKTELWQVSVDGGEPRKLEIDLPRMRNLSVHPDGRQIAFQAGNLPKSEIWVMQNFLSPREATH